jgi:hypothetical protein
VELLLEHGADVHFENVGSELCALGYLIRKHKPVETKCAELLFKHGAGRDVYRKICMNGMTPVQYARKCKQPEMIRALEVIPILEVMVTISTVPRLRLKRPWWPRVYDIWFKLRDLLLHGFPHETFSPEPWRLDWAPRVLSGSGRLQRNRQLNDTYQSQLEVVAKHEESLAAGEITEAQYLELCRRELGLVPDAVDTPEAVPAATTAGAFRPFRAFVRFSNT